MPKTFESVFPAFNAISKQLEAETKLSGILETPNHIANVMYSVCPTLNACDSVVNNFALPLSNLWYALRKLGRSLYFIFLLRLFK